MADNVSALPAAMQAKRAELQNSNPTTLPEATPAAAPAPALPTATPTETKVTISKEEFNDLQAAAGKARAAEGRAEALAMDVEALTRRLTELEEASKGITKPTAKAPSAPSVGTWEPTPVQFTDKDTEDYGESKPFVVKVVQEVLNGEIPKLIARIEALEEQIQGVRGIAEGASKTASTVKAKSFTDQVRDRVKNFDECTNHKHWHDFLEATDPDTGDTWAELVQKNFSRENVVGMVRVFTKFKEQYKVGVDTPPSGYEGALPGSGGGPEDDIETGPKVLPFSKRREAHKKFLNKEISYEEYEKIKNEYDAADREGRVDYNK